MTQDAAIAATVFGGGGPAAAAVAVGSKVMQRYAEPLAEGALRGASKVWVVLAHCHKCYSLY
jgi:hypothetical protein